MDSALGLVLLALYVVGMVSLAAGVTYVAIRIFPTRDKPAKKEDGEPPSDDGAGSGAGRLYRKARRAAAGG